MKLTHKKAVVSIGIVLLVALPVLASIYIKHKSDEYRSDSMALVHVWNHDHTYCMENKEFWLWTKIELFGIVGPPHMVIPSNKIESHRDHVMYETMVRFRDEYSEFLYFERSKVNTLLEGVRHFLVGYKPGEPGNKTDVKMLFGSNGKVRSIGARIRWIEEWTTGVTYFPDD